MKIREGREYDGKVKNKPQDLRSSRKFQDKRRKAGVSVALPRAPASEKNKNKGVLKLILCVYISCWKLARKSTNVTDGGTRLLKKKNQVCNFSLDRTEERWSFSLCLSLSIYLSLFHAFSHSVCLSLSHPPILKWAKSIHPSASLWCSWELNRIKQERK